MVLFEAIADIVLATFWFWFFFGLFMVRNGVNRFSVLCVNWMDNVVRHSGIKFASNMVFMRAPDKLDERKRRCET
jgi:hypothetical protein